MKRIIDIKPYAQIEKTDELLELVKDKALTSSLKRINKVALISPLQIPSDFFDAEMASRKRYFSYPPYGLGLVARELSSAGIEVSIIDLNYAVLSEIENFIKDPINFEKNHLFENMDSFKPDIVGVTCMFTITHDSFTKTVNLLREYNKDLIIFAGGVHITNDPERIKKEIPEIDFLMPHESELRFAELVKSVNSTMDAQKGNSLPFVDQSDTLGQKDEDDKDSEDTVESSIPDYCDLDIGRYSKFGEVGAYRFFWRTNTKAATIQSNRGCRAHCTFCSVEHFNGKGVRGRSVDSVVDELFLYKEKYGVNHIMWLDDDLFYKPKRAIELFRRIVDSKLDITWDASNGIIASAASEELLAACEESGCIGMHVGIESGSEKILREIKKPSGVKHFHRLGDWLRKHQKIFTKGFLIMGFPNETFGDLRATIDLAKRMALDWYTVSVLTPLPSTKIYDQMVELGLINSSKVNSKQANYGSMQTGTQKKLEESRKFSLDEILKLKKFGDEQIVPREKLTELWFEVDYEINYQRINTEHNIDRLRKLSLFLGDVNKRMTNFSNPVSLYFEHLVNQKMGMKETDMLLDRARNVVSCSSLWSQRVNYLNLEELI